METKKDEKKKESRSKYWKERRESQKREVECLKKRVEELENELKHVKEEMERDFSKRIEQLKKEHKINLRMARIYKSGEFEKKLKEKDLEASLLRKELRKRSKEVTILKDKDIQVDEVRNWYFNEGEKLKRKRKMMSEREMKKRRKKEKEEEEEEKEIFTQTQTEDKEEFFYPTSPIFDSDDFDNETIRKICLSMYDGYIESGKKKGDAQEILSYQFGISTRTIRRWISSWTKLGQLTGKNTSRGPKWLLGQEDLQQEARKWIRNQKKGFTVKKFLNEYLQQKEETKCIKTIETARMYLHRLGFRYGIHGKQKYIDGHEREDVVKDREKFLNILIPLLNDKDTKVIFQDESIYYTKDTHKYGWGDEGGVLRKKGMGKGIMVSAWFDEEGILSLNEEEYKTAKSKDSTIKQEALFYLKFGKIWGYYDFEKFQKDVEDVHKIAAVKYPNKKVNVMQQTKIEKIIQIISKLI
jgi:hypothetical protein